MTCRPVFFLRTCRVRKWFLLLPLTVGMALRGAEIKINFGDFAAGQTPTNFFSALAGSGPPGDWKIVLDTAPPLLAPLTPQAQQTAAAFRQPVLAQLSQDRTDNRFPLFIYDGQVFKDFKLTTQFKIVGGTMEQMAGIVFRYQNASNFYVFRASALGHNVRFYKLVNGKFVDPSPPLDLNIATNVWHTLSVQCEGNRINCTLDQTVIPAIQTSVTFDSGKVGFWTMADSVTYFGDTTIDYTPIIPPAQLLVRDILKKYPRLVGLRIYMPDDQGQLRVVAAKDPAEIGQPGTDAEKNTLEKGAVYFGRGKGKVAVDLPLTDRNGNPIAAVRVELKSYIFGETQDMAVDRARVILREMQKRVLTRADLMP